MGTTRHVTRRGLSRRNFIKFSALGGVAAGSVALTACGQSRVDGGRTPGQGRVFQHGIASGDPLTDRIVFWTRVTPATAGAAVPVDLVVARDPDLTQVVARYSSSASVARDYTVKIDGAGLQAGTTYYYQFSAQGQRTAVGRTRTLPDDSAAPVDRLRFALVSCASYPHGFFNSYARLAERADLDCVIHLGDYIYEYGNQDGEYGADVQAGGRRYAPEHEMIVLDDYRTRHAHYKLDPDLQAVHQQHPFICIWDDHESTNDSYRDGAENHNDGEGDWNQRKATSIQAYFEWMPIREPGAASIGPTVRSFRFGDLVHLVMLDTRLLDRDASVEPNGAPIANTGFSTFFQTGEFANPDRTLLGPAQEAFLRDELTGATSTWKLIGQQVMFGQLKFQGQPNATGGSQYINPDQWDGYDPARSRVFELLRGAAPGGGIDNAVVLTGDIHTSWAMDLTEDPNNPLAYDPTSGDGSAAVEFVATSVTSPGLDELQGVGDGALMTQNPHMKYIELSQHGYVLLDITPQRLLGEYWFVDDILTSTPGESFITAFPVAAGMNRLGAAVSEPSSPREDAPALAPRTDATS